MISSADNPRIKRLRGLHDRARRRAQRLFIVEGVRLVEEALAAGATPETVIFVRSTLLATARGRALHGRLSHQPGLPVPLEVTPAVMRLVADTATPSGVLAAMPLPAPVEPAQLPRRAGLTLVLDGVRDPGNAGTILRTAAAAGVDGVIMIDGCADAFAPKVVRAGMGAHFRIPIAADVPLEKAETWLAAAGQVVLAAADAPAAIYDVDLLLPTAIVLGGEAHGLPRELRLPDAIRRSIPMPGGSESLNVAAAAAAILFEAVRQRRHV